tara:strand:+ start:1270 stop:1677 length:408 start_codon:yes stop_codon:yes gene_type:complete
MDTPLAVAAEVLGILSLLQSHSRDCSQATAAQIHPVSDQIRMLIGSGDLAELTPAGLATRQGKSIDHINRQLKRESGVTIGQLLASARLEKACDRLRDPKAVIGDVAEAVGYLDQNYFARWFRQQTGQSPTQWRS